MQRTILWPIKCFDTQNCYIRLLFTLTANKTVTWYLKDSSKGYSTKQSTWLNKISTHGTINYIDSLAGKAWTNNQFGDETPSALAVQRQALYHFPRSCGKYVNKQLTNQPKELNSFLYTGCPRKNVPDFGRVFLMLKYADITQNTYIQSCTVTEIMAREVWNFDSCYTLTDYQIHIKTGRNVLLL